MSEKDKSKWSESMMGDDDSQTLESEEQTPPVEEADVEPAEEQPTEPVEPTEETEPEPAKTEEETPTKPDYAALAEQYGINKQFGSLENALRALPEQNRYLTRLEQERAREREERVAERAELEILRKLQETPKQPVTIDPDEFIQDPGAALKRLGIPTADEVRSMVDERAQSLLMEDRKDRTQQESSHRAREFVKSHADFQTHYPAIQELYNEKTQPDGTNPMDNLPHDVGLELLYHAAKGRQPVKPKVVPSPGADKKDQARTAGGGPSGKQASSGKPLTREQLENMSEEELEKLFSPSG